MFSFDPVKNITCIDGGALVVKTEEELQKIHEMRLIGMGQPSSVMYENKRAWTYDVKCLGFRYHMANLHAAIGLSQLAKLPNIGESRRETARLYNDSFQNMTEIRVPPTDFDDIIPFLYYLRVKPSDRQKLRQHMLAKGVETGIHWQPGHWFSCFRDYRQGNLDVTEKVGHEILSLPLHSNMTDEEVAKVIESVETYYKGG
jgi:dTDP-4-amino-4,6-dideoxygalactose transaminase